MTVLADDTDLESFLLLAKEPGRPAVFRDCLSDWPAVAAGERQWSGQRLAAVAGTRTVPVELGSRYTDDGWTQALMTVGEFCDRHLLGRDGGGGPRGYLAQHELLDQVPQLREDIAVPDLCYSGDEEGVDVNVWIGPAGTVSPLHTDPKHNFLCQAS